MLRGSSIAGNVWFGLSLSLLQGKDKLKKDLARLFIFTIIYIYVHMCMVVAFKISTLLYSTLVEV